MSTGRRSVSAARPTRIGASPGFTMDSGCRRRRPAAHRRRAAQPPTIRRKTLDAVPNLDSIGPVANQCGMEGMSRHVAVLMGGWSAERDVSLRSGRARADALTRSGYRVTRIDVGRDIASVLATVKPDVALNVLHGRPGEDGTLQGLLEVVGIPYSHSGVLASALAMQKDVAKALFRAASVPVADG